MDYEQLQRYQQSLLERALIEGIRRNEEQTQIWLEYKKRHEKVIEGLESFSRELTIDCMVPIGKKALMRGKLTHTNEILVSLGEAYFAKYSSSQALALCNRRIKRANDILESLDKERNLYEMRQRIPECFDAFGSDERKDLMEHWDKEKLDDWRVEHRQREKEYRKKLAELKSAKKQDIKTEDDLFAKLDALELQEELEAELHRLEAKSPAFYAQDLDENDSDEESDDYSDCSDETEDESEKVNEEEEEKIPNQQRQSNYEEAKIETKNTSNISNMFVANDKIESSEIDSYDEKIQKIPSNNSVSASVNFADSSSEEIDAARSSNETTSSKGHERRVVFGEPEVKYFNNEERQRASLKDLEDEDSSDDIIKITFKHSDNEPTITDSDNEEIITSPRGIYRILMKPKSILKKPSICIVDNLSPIVDSSNDEIHDNQDTAISAYNNVVHDVREYVIDKPIAKMIEQVEEKRPVSKFKRDRAAMKK